MFRYLGILFTIFAFTFSLNAQEKIEWLSWEKAVQKNKLEKRKFIVDVYTDWCSWCKKMDQLTFQSPPITKYINEHYYAIKFNAEQKEDIEFNNKVYKYVSAFGRRGYHELANEIMNGRMTYPTVVFLDENLNVLQPIPGFQEARTFEMIISYFAGNHYMTMPWQKYTRNFKSENYPLKAITPKDVQPNVQTVGTKKGN